jgi:Skp family chaperone for outer membrane proteins
VKRKLAASAAIAALGAGIYLCTQLAARGTPPAGAAAKPLKIAIVNLPLIIKKYKKFDVYDGQLKKFVEEARVKEETVRKELIHLQEEAQRGTEDKSGLEDKITAKKRELEDLGKALQKEFLKRQQEQIVQLYQEIEDMVKRLAVSNGWSLVLQYGDVVDPKDKYNPRMIQHKMLDAICTPMYAADGIDVSEVVVKYLNEAYGARASAGR